MRYVYLFIKTLQRYKNYFNYAKNGATYLRLFPCSLCPRVPAPCVLAPLLLLCPCALAPLCPCARALSYLRNFARENTFVTLSHCHIVTVSPF